MKPRGRRMKVHHHIEDMRKLSKIMETKMNVNIEMKKRPMMNQKKKLR